MPVLKPQIMERDTVKLVPVTMGDPVQVDRF